jgi:hypothetical protein
MGQALTRSCKAFQAIKAKEKKVAIFEAELEAYRKAVLDQNPSVKEGILNNIVTTKRMALVRDAKRQARANKE